MRTYLDLRELFDEAAALNLGVRVVPDRTVKVSRRAAVDEELAVSVMTETLELDAYDGPHDRVVYAGVYDGTLYHTPLE